MNGPDVASLRPTGTMAQRFRWYRALALALTSARSPAGAVFEASTTSPIPSVTVRPGGLLDSLPGTPSPSGPVAPAPRPARRGSGRVGLLWPFPQEPNPPREEAAFPLELPALDPCLRKGGWAGVQTFWVHRGGSRLDIATRCWVVAPDRRVRDRLADAVAAHLSADWYRALHRRARVRWHRPWSLREWRRGGARSIPPGAWAQPGPAGYRTAELGLCALQLPDRPGGAHSVVFGASGAGKTTYLAGFAARAVRAGQSVVVLDLHGDLAPQVVARLSDSDRARLLTVDASELPVPGISGLVAGATSPDRAAAHFVAAVKRLSPDGVELAWGFRLERIFDIFARLVLETGGSLVDLYALLTDADRRDSARLATRRATTARFLDELGPILRRDPEFLWSAATRLSKVVLVPALMDLLAPSDGGLDIEGLLASGRTLLLRLPMGALGPESAAFAGTLVLGRLYLGLAARADAHPEGPPVLFVLDEAQALSPRLVAEVLAEGRKFGIEAIIATQYPDRLAPEVRSAAAGAAASFIAFRVPPATTASVAPWLGIEPRDATGLLSGLPTGTGVTLDADRGGLVWVPSTGPGPGEPGAAWRLELERTRREFGTESEELMVSDAPGTEQVLLAILAADESGRRLRPEEVVGAAGRLPGEPIASERLELAWRAIVRGPELESTPAGLRLSAAGERRLGLGRSTGAARESAEHRRLLLVTFRIFARHGYALEILRQGRFDTTLPDALYRQLGHGGRAETPAELADRLDRTRTGWAWRFFRGRDVHVEAEVSGALRPERIRHGWSKAAGRGAFALYVVGDPMRAGRVRRTLRNLRLGPDRAQVWTLRDSTTLSAPNA
ncbi:MAG: type IV secretory system conjugative DNA transfer family protein [Thermoplasmata archaeon]